MARTDPAARHERDLIRLCHAGLDLGRFQAEMMRRLRALVPADAIFFATADPATLLFTGAVAEDPLGAATERFLDNEFGADDVNKFQSLAQGARRVSSLDVATRGERSHSTRYRDIMAPLGLGDELRAALVGSAGCWGYLCLHREESPYGFTPEEARTIARVAPHLADGCRRAAVPETAAAPLNPAAPGVVVLAPDLSVTALTAEAEYWLSLVADPYRGTRPVPVAVYSVAARLNAIDRHGVGTAPTVRVPTRSGAWLLVHATRLGDDGAVAVVVQPAPHTDTARLLFSARGLTEREEAVASLVLRGASTRQIAGELHISPNTVQDHLKSVFDKVGVRSRRDLVGHVLTGGKGPGR
jgi:DNA-binding CsgD family transcriptional regulator